MKKINIFLILILLISGCSASKKLTQYQKTSYDSGFDTAIILLAYTENEDQFNTYFAQMESEFVKYNAYFDKYHTYEHVNNLKTINDNAGKTPVVVDQILIDLLLEAKTYYTISNGSFDITMGSVLNVWHDYREAAILENEFNPVGPVPSLQELQQANQSTGWQYLEIDDDTNTVYLTNPKTSLDVGGIAKGYATEKVAQTLEASGLTSGAVNAGGNVKTIGTKPDNAAWGVAIALPSAESNDSIDVIRIPESMALVTSGIYQRYYIGDDGKTYHHIIDPKTLYPVNYYNSVTVVTKDSGIADALTKSIIMKPYSESLAFVDEYNAQHPDDPIYVVWIAKEDGTHDDWKLIKGYRVTMSENLKQYSDAFKQ